MAQAPPLPRPAPADLLHTKLMPPRLRAERVARTALLERLDRGLAYKLTLVSAPAGYGKTTLVSEWLTSRSEQKKLPPVAWLSLDNGDNDPARFWRYLITACQRLDASVGDMALTLLHAARRPTFEPVITSLLNDLARLPCQSVLILDDYHAIDAPQIDETVAFLLEHLPASLHLLILSRTEPALPLARLRARNEICELRAADLRFSTADTATFLRQNVPFALPPAAVDALVERTEGWVAGLQLVTLALQRQSPHRVERFLATLSGTHRHVLDYLATEVLAAQPEPLQQFLLQTTFLNRLTASLCDAVTGRNDSAVLLEGLERANLFLDSLDEEQQWYRYHPLFAEAMHQIARRPTPPGYGEATLRGLYNRASLWFEQHGYLDDAIETALSAQAYARAAALMERMIETGHLRSEKHTLRRWIEQLPTDLLYTQPRLCFAYAIAILFTSDRSAPETAAQLQQPLQMAEQHWLAEEDEAQLGQLRAFRCMVAFWQGDFGAAFAAARAALDLLPAHDVEWRGTSILNLGLAHLFAGKMHEASTALQEGRALCAAAGNGYGVRAATHVLGLVSIEAGDPGQAEGLFRQVLAEAAEDPLDQGHALVGLASLAYEQNDLDEAERCATQAIELSRRHADELGPQHAEESLTVPATLVLARVAHARQETAHARQLLAGLLVETHLSPLLRREVKTLAARLALAVGDLAAVERWRAAHPIRDDAIFRLQQEREALVVARLLIAQGEAGEAIRLLERWRADARTHGRGARIVENLAISALAYVALDQRSEAKERLIAALTLARRGEFQRLFLDEGAAMAALLQALYPDVRDQPLALSVRKLLLAFAEEPSGPVKEDRHTGLPLPDGDVPCLIEPLSAQEERVLRLVAAGLSNPAIAEELIVSVNTVKTQVQSIYRKLDVHSRAEARDVARQLGLI